MKKLFFLIILFCGIQSTQGQDGVGLRSGINLQKKVTKKVTLNLNGQARFNNDISYLQTYLFELGSEYKISKSFDAAVYYRFVNRKKDETKDFKQRHRFYADLSYGKKFGSIKFENRLRYQHQFKDNDGVTEFDASYIRNKIEASYSNKSKFTPYVSNDFFFQIGGTLDQLRPKIGVSYKINKKNAVDASVFKDIDLVGTENPGPVLGLIYKLKL
ncbi:DUF2490 domain-containing protein [Lacihabitans soyangensis]|nr:DUF2490 domain-containing protein [Lacihabitans soyangensis]